MSKRKGELSPAGINRDWPHQVALPVDSLKDTHFVHDFCRGLSLCPRGHSVRRGDVEYRLFCFSELAHANLFRAQFKGEQFNPPDRGRGTEWFVWHDESQR